MRERSAGESDAVRIEGTEEDVESGSLKSTSDSRNGGEKGMKFEKRGEEFRSSVA